MAKNKPGVPSVLEISKKINKNNLLPVYYFFGEDSFSLNIGLKAVEKAVQPFITSEFDKETFYGENKTLSEVLDFASAFPFGSEKKFIVFKEFEKVKDKKILSSYLKSPPGFTVMVLIHNGAITGFKSEPFPALIEKNYIFTAKELKGENLLNWIINYCEEAGKYLSKENAGLIVDIVGEDRNLLESQLEKIFTFLGERKEIVVSDITSLSTELKEFTIFDLQNAVGKKDKAIAVKTAYKLLDQGKEPTFIIYMLTRYFTGLSRINELREKKIPENAAAGIVGTHPYYYKDYLNARNIYSDRDLFRISEALLKAELLIKTTSTDYKSIITLLLAEILD
jgi:DNA polymerase III subunit delta